MPACSVTNETFPSQSLLQGSGATEQEGGGESQGQREPNPNSVFGNDRATALMS